MHGTMLWLVAVGTHLLGLFGLELTVSIREGIGGRLGFRTIREVLWMMNARVASRTSKPVQNFP